MILSVWRHGRLSHSQTCPYWESLLVVSTYGSKWSFRQQKTTAKQLFLFLKNLLNSHYSRRLASLIISQWYKKGSPHFSIFLNMLNVSPFLCENPPPCVLQCGSLPTHPVSNKLKACSEELSLGVLPPRISFN